VKKKTKRVSKRQVSNTLDNFFIAGEMKLMMAAWEAKGVKMNVQFKTDAGVCAVTTMNNVEALGSLETAKAIIINGLLSHQGIDSLIQTFEKRPELLDRFKKLFGHGCVLE
jgi:hypothetical protein